MNPGQLSHAVVSLIIPVLVLTYISAIDKCNCRQDWRYTVVKATAILAIVLIVFSLFTALQGASSGLMMAAISILNLVNIYALFTYVGDLNAGALTCTCLNTQHRTLNTFMYYYRYVPVILLLLSVALPLLAGTIVGARYLGRRVSRRFSR